MDILRTELEEMEQTEQDPVAVSLLLKIYTATLLHHLLKSVLSNTPEFRYASVHYAELSCTHITSIQAFLLARASSYQNTLPVSTVIFQIEHLINTMARLDARYNLGYTDVIQDLRTLREHAQLCLHLIGEWRDSF